MPQFRALHHARCFVFIASLVIAVPSAFAQLELILPVQQGFGMVDVGNCTTVNLGMRCHTGDSVTVTGRLIGACGDSTAFKIVSFPVFPYVGQHTTFDTFVTVQYCPKRPGLDSIYVVIDQLDPFIPRIPMFGNAVGVMLTMAGNRVVDLTLADTSSEFSYTLSNSADTLHTICYDMIATNARCAVAQPAEELALARSCDASDPLPPGYKGSGNFGINQITTVAPGAGSIRVIFHNQFGYALDSILCRLHPVDDRPDINCRFNATKVFSRDSQPVIAFNITNPIVVDSIAIVGTAAHASSWVRSDGKSIQFPATLGTDSAIDLTWIFAPQASDTGDMSDARITLFYQGGSRTIASAKGAFGLGPTAVNDPGSVRPDRFAVGPATPNPASEFVRIPFDGPAGEIDMIVTNMVGVTVAAGRQRRDIAGQRAFEIDARAYPAGQYRYALRAGTQRVVGSFWVVR